MNITYLSTNHSQGLTLCRIHLPLREREREKRDLKSFESKVMKTTGEQIWKTAFIQA